MTSPPPDPIRLRPARAADLPAIRGLVRQARLNPFGLAWPRFWVAAGDHDRPLACGQVKPHADGSRELASIVVHPKERGRGLARRVIERLLEQEAGSTLYLTCRPNLRSFYEKFGFQPVGLPEMPPYFRFASRLVGGLHRLKLVPTPLLVMRLRPPQPE